MVRGKRPPSDPLPDGIRQDARWRTRHVLRPDEDTVKELLDSLDDRTWSKFTRVYPKLLEKRFREERASFDELAKLATEHDVFIGCSCPTKSNPRVDHCHTFLALGFMKGKYPDLHVEYPRQD